MFSLNKINLVVILTLFSFFAYGQQYDYLKASTAQGAGITIDNSTAWTDISSTTIDVTNVSNVLVSASINMRPDGSNTNNREANYNIYISGSSSISSGIIKRQIIKSTETGVERWGIGTLVHIFDTSSLSGNVTFTLEHSNTESGIDRNIYSASRLSAVALTTAMFNNELSNDVVRLNTEIGTTSATFVPVTNITTNALTLPNQGDIYVAASINSKAKVQNSIAEYRLEYTTDDVTWNQLGNKVKRTMINNIDDGIISLVGLLQGQPAGNNYKFRLAHRNESGKNEIVTYNTNLVAVALSHAGGSYFPSFYTEVDENGVSITGESTPQQVVTSTNILTGANINTAQPDVYVHAQFLVSASNLNENNNASVRQRMRAANQLTLDDGSTKLTETKYYRYLADNSDFGSGGTIGIAENLAENTSYTIGMEHEIADISNPDATADETLTTSEVILTGFLTFDKPNSTLGIEEFLATNGLQLYTNKNTVFFTSEKPINAKLDVFNLLGQKIASKQLINQRTTQFAIDNYNGIVFVKLETLNKKMGKKLIITH